MATKLRRGPAGQGGSPGPPRGDGVTPVDAFVAEMARDLGLGDSAMGERTSRVLRRLALWTTGEGLALDREVVLDPDTVERFIEHGISDDPSRATYRSVLRRVGPVLTKRAPWEPRAAAVARRQVAAPYSDTEVELLRVDAAQQPTPKRRRAAAALLALGLGAGLDGRWNTRVAAADVARHGAVVTVSVGPPAPRKVVVLNGWEDAIEDLAANAGEDFLVGGRSLAKNRAGQLASDLVVPTGHPRLLAPRLRSTWLVHHLNLGTRLPELARAAGLQGVTVFSDLLPFVAELAPERSMALLRGAR